nr:ribonuclease H-like domain-containing protein [Tanacetum cinerariifolium]
DKPPKNKGQASGSQGSDIDQYDPLFLHSNDTSRVPLINFKLEDLKRKDLSKNNREYNTTDPIPDVKGGVATMSKNESHRGYQSHNVSKTVMLSKDQSTSNSLTDDQYKKLMALISEKWSNSIPANIAGASQHVTYTVFNMFNVSKLNKTVGHPNGTKAIVTHVGSLRLTDQIVIHDVLVVPGYEVSLLYVHKLNKDNKFRVILDENFINHRGDEYVSILKL